MNVPTFKSNDEKKAFWSGWMEERNKVYDDLKARGMNKFSLEEYFAAGEVRSIAYVAKWNEEHAGEDEEQTPAMEESTHTLEESTPSLDEQTPIIEEPSPATIDETSVHVESASAPTEAERQARRAQRASRTIERLSAAYTRQQDIETTGISTFNAMDYARTSSAVQAIVGRSQHTEPTTTEDKKNVTKPASKQKQTAKQLTLWTAGILMVIGCIILGGVASEPFSRVGIVASFVHTGVTAVSSGVCFGILRWMA